MLLKYIKYNKEHNQDEHISIKSSDRYGLPIILLSSQDIYYIDPKILFYSEYKWSCTNINDLYEDMKEEYLRLYFSQLDRLSRMNLIYLNLIYKIEAVKYLYIYGKNNESTAIKGFYTFSDNFKIDTVISEGDMNELINQKSLKDHKKIKSIEKTKEFTIEKYKEKRYNTETIRIYNKNTKKVDINIIKEGKPIKINETEFSIDLFNRPENNIKAWTKKVKNINVERFSKLESDRFSDKRKINIKDLLNKDNQICFTEYNCPIIRSEKHLYIKDYNQGDLNKTFLIKIGNEDFYKDPEILFKDLILISDYENHEELKDEYLKFLKTYMYILKNLNKEKMNVDYRLGLIISMKDSKKEEIKLIKYPHSTFGFKRPSKFELNDKNCKYICENLIAYAKEKQSIYKQLGPLEYKEDLYLNNTRYHGANPIIRYNNKSYKFMNTYGDTYRFKKVETIYDKFLNIVK